ncbi:MAG TPA: hypothetical protein VNS55_14005 [Nocardioides sp.]|nr:hypothetical protein [Nocardioides sp.]
MVVATTGALGPPPGPPAAHHRATWLVWAAVAAVLLVVVAVGLVVLLGGDDESAKDPARSHARATTEPATGGSSDRPTRGAGTSSASAGGPAGDLLAEVGRIRVPGTAPASTDARTGAPVTFGAAHLTDGDTTTCWRVAGDASGTALTIIFTRPVTLTEVGMVNGYAKSYPGYDGYRLNRKVLAVRWVLDDGTEVAQRLTVDRRMQTVPVDAGAGATTTLRLEIDQVSPPGPGEFGKDFTAISELHLVGSPS